MASRETCKLLYDVQEAGRLVLSFTRGKALEDYMVVWGVIEKQLPVLLQEVSALLEEQG
jgi:hypothetical protein